MTNFNVPAKISCLGEDWQLVKNANDPTVGFDYNRVNTTDFDCSEIRRGLYRVMVLGNIQPSQGSLEKPLRLVFVGFSPTPIFQQFLVRDDLRKMSIYKADIGNFATSFTDAFFGQNAKSSENYDIKPYPTIDGGEDGREQADE